MLRAQHHQAAERGARHHGFLARRQQADIGNVKAVDVLGGIDRVDHLVGVNVARQRQLHEDAVHLRRGVELFHQRQQVGLGGVGVELVLVGIHPRLDRHPALGADIDLAGRVLAHQHHRKPRRDAVRVFQMRNMAGDVFPKFRGVSFPVDDLRGHLSSSSMVG
jgi:hypothetical protein